jgi:hypothetical protein
MVVNGSKKSPKVAQNFYCKVCDYVTCKLCDFNKHLATDKHHFNQNGSKMIVNYGLKSPKVAEYKCDCGKVYKYDSGYYRHKKKCFVKTEELTYKELTYKELTDKELIMMLVKQNTELMDLVKSGATHNSNNTTNSNNKTFNLQFFLNETCKDAMNIMEFVDSIKLQISDLENVGQIGYAEGISKVVINNLKDIDSTKRPIHCSDIKRETLYIRDDDKWEKDDNKAILTKAIKSIANKNIRQISEWQKLHPNYSDPDSKQNDTYMQIVLNSMSGSTKEEADKNYEKIVKNVIKETIIEKV